MDLFEAVGVLGMVPVQRFHPGLVQAVHIGDGVYPVPGSDDLPGGPVFHAGGPEASQTGVPSVGHLSEVGFQSSEADGAQSGHPVQRHPVFNII